jgi:hypothetical protein
METDIDMVKLGKAIHMQVHLKRHKEFKIRLWIALKLIKFACWICRFNLKIEEEK